MDEETRKIPTTKTHLPHIFDIEDVQMCAHADTAYFFLLRSMEKQFINYLCWPINDSVGRFWCSSSLVICMQFAYICSVIVVHTTISSFYQHYHQFRWNWFLHIIIYFFFVFLLIRFDAMETTHKAVNLLTFGDHVHTIYTWLTCIWFVFVIRQHENALHIRNAFTLIHLHASGLSNGSIRTKRSLQCNEIQLEIIVLAFLLWLVLFFFLFISFYTVCFIPYTTSV